VMCAPPPPLGSAARAAAAATATTRARTTSSATRPARHTLKNLVKEKMPSRSSRKVVEIVSELFETPRHL
jgi:hypothetical protein